MHSWFWRRLAAVAAVLCVAVAHAQPGDYDTSWAGGCGSTFTSDGMLGLVAADAGRTYVVGVDQSGNSPYALRCEVNGGRDPAFAGGVARVAVPAPFAFIARTAAAGSDGRLVIVGNALRTDTGKQGVGAIRINLDGTMDTAYGLYQGLFIELASPPSITTAASQPDGRILVGGHDGQAAPDPLPLLVRLSAEGGRDASFDQAGIQAQLASGGSVEGLARASDGAWLASGWGVFPTGTSSQARASVTRLSTDGTSDPLFGNRGTATIDAWPFGHATSNASVAALADGRIVIAGVYTVMGRGPAGVVVARFTASGALDTSFGQGGWTTIPLYGAAASRILVQGDGKLLVAVTSDDVDAQLLRLTADGALDGGFGRGGRVTFTSMRAPMFATMQGGDKVILLVAASKFGYATPRLLLDGPSTFTTLTSSGAIAPRGEAVTLTATITPAGADGTFVRFDDESGAIPGCSAITLAAGVAHCSHVPATVGEHTLRAIYMGSSEFGPAISASLDVAQVTAAPGTQMAIEFYHGLYGHYFITTNAAEAVALDAGSPTGWRRTGAVFPVWPLATAGRSDVCRFWTDQAFAPTSSHFYTPYAAECAAVRASRDWIFEGDVFALGLTQAEGACGEGTVPLYRYYNDGQGGAPNHRYSAVYAIRPDMAGRGWIAEGNGPDVVFACLPSVTQ